MGRIKNFFLARFFLKEFTMAVDNVKKHYDIENKKIRYQASRDKEMYEVVKRALNEKNEIIGYAVNKLDDEVLIVRSLGYQNIDFYLFSKSYKAKHPRIMATTHTALSGDTYIEIIDVLMEDDNVGNGSILMPYFIDYCKSTDAKYIKGWLSDVDKDHFDRSEHYYAKHGFDVSFNEDRSSGSIRMELK